ncbi:P pilus assembly/Cpx signaling pathway, periplasmic inhibitor/zinc-resistance associated protein [Rubidibacter lacunae KORDI 51-2]|uniref:P pilus assembly/Cpx signaling pathway, periplasmic inhibitor/zinc-resistance associated protein n=1 Tax=Rubidibacter lacunae KORDI 51-2 TaxID=582515 RepID=U5DIU3_9CHRO|nr:Spy/CpxP family protein refolding chaperone [Rubidibacter lacunae]ERN40514.1 P pilus assembly/Cpx signaling pathway, periplasmic inhibitor/zinc-resistance associated protein [Rubidibacter lacunae KORDI 51-2]
MNEQFRHLTGLSTVVLSLSCLLLLSLPSEGATAGECNRFARAQTPIAHASGESNRPPRPRAGAGGPPPTVTIEELNLSNQQLQQISTIRAAYRARIEQRETSLERAQDRLRELMAGTATVSEIRAQYGRVEELRQQLGNLHFESTLEMRNVLTPEQRQELNEMLEERRAKRRCVK